MSLADRFEAKYEPEPNTGCWLWLGSLSWYGYGWIWDGKRNTHAHRVSYELYRGQIPGGLHLDHLCRVRCCVNPAHLEAVTSAENTSRGLLGGRSHCKRGHEFTEANSIRRPSRPNERACRQCETEGWLAYRKRRKEQRNARAI